MGKIFWLASYPKSGNTWLRIFLTNYWRNADTPADINQLEATPIASSRVLFETLTGIEASDLTADEIDHVRPAVYRAWAEGESRTLFAKVHDAYTYLPDGRALFPPEITAGAIYLVRNPLDVALSLAAHNGQSVERMIENMGREDYALSPTKSGLQEQLRQKLGSWSSHVRSWVAPEVNFVRLVIRYEDLYAWPQQEFSRVIRFIGEAEDPGRLARAVDFSRFCNLQQQEAQHGFQERPGPAAKFFRRGRPREGEETLNKGQIEHICLQHGAVMRSFGYLS